MTLLAPMTNAHRARLEDRLLLQAPSNPNSYRTSSQRDRDRILYSAAFQRLAYVTQVTAPESGHTFHNRLSHSLKVAQVGRRNAERLQTLVKKGDITGKAASLVKALDPDSVEACCLAHDLGHPPFGHLAEMVLHEKASVHVADGFEGNAQSFRIVTRLAVRSEGEGLDLTRRTLGGLLKYPWRHWPQDPLGPDHKRSHKWGYYRDDVDAFRFAREFHEEESDTSLPKRSLEAEIMDWADDLTYAVHDVDDFFRAGLIPLDRLGQPKSPELKTFRKLLLDAKQADPRGFPRDDPDKLVEALHRIVRLHGPDIPWSHTTDMRAQMHSFGSKLITRYLEAFKVDNEPKTGAPRLTISAREKLEVTALKLLVVVYVIRAPGLAVVQHGQTRVIADLFDWYYHASSPRKEDGGDHRLFPPGVKERLANSSDTSTERARIVTDLIAGLTEESAIQLHRRLSGGWTAPTLDATARIG